jgi:protein transport protein SEC13
LIKIWTFNNEENSWNLTQTLEGHKDWIRDVSWAPNIGLPYETIASCSQDQKVIIWTNGENLNEWNQTVLNIDKVVWRVSWSITGNILAVSSCDNKISLWKESLEGKWSKVSTLENENKN